MWTTVRNATQPEAEDDEQPHVHLERGAGRESSASGDAERRSSGAAASRITRQTRRISGACPLTLRGDGGEALLLGEDLRRLELLTHRFERLDCLLLHLRRHIVSGELRPCEERRQARGGTAAHLEVGEDALQVLIGCLGRAAREPVGREGALQAGVGGDHRASWVGLRPEIVERLVEHVGERREQRFR